jgi:hypothetical protein
MARTIHLILASEKAKYFLAKNLTEFAELTRRANQFIEMPAVARP